MYFPRKRETSRLSHFAITIFSKSNQSSRKKLVLQPGLVDWITSSSKLNGRDAPAYRLVTRFGKANSKNKRTRQYPGMIFAPLRAGKYREGRTMELMEIDYKFILLVMDAALFALGFIMVLFGLAILAKKAFGAEVQNLAATTSKLAQKGLADDIAGLVGNASALMNALQEMVKTARGIGMFLILTGGIFIAASLLLLVEFILT
jgi:hypothetical protein